MHHRSVVANATEYAFGMGYRGLKATAKLMPTLTRRRKLMPDATRRRNESTEPRCKTRTRLPSCSPASTWRPSLNWRQPRSQAPFVLLATKTAMAGKPLFHTRFPAHCAFARASIRAAAGLRTDPSRALARCLLKSEVTRSMARLRPVFSNGRSPRLVLFKKRDISERTGFDRRRH